MIIDSQIKARELDGMKIIRFEDSIYYANVENFINSVLGVIDVDYDQVLEELDALKDRMPSKGDNPGNKVKKNV